MSSIRIIHSLIEQCEADLLLGARWLPMKSKTPGSNRKTKRPQPPATTDAPVNAEASHAGPVPVSDQKIIVQKQKKLDEIAREVAKCCKCTLATSRKKVVPGQGNPNARIVFVGEAPGANEDEQGLAFVGRAGKLLTNIIEAMGLKRDDVFIGNILKCRPPDNRDPQTTEILACSDYLHRQLDIIEPEIIVALGAHAARTLLDNHDPIGRLRGKVYAYQSHPLARSIKLVATYHPAYLLRAYTQDNRMRVWSDMQLVLKELGMPIPKKQQR